MSRDWIAVSARASVVYSFHVLSGPIIKAASIKESEP
jgi:hypothetical protein